MKKIIVLVLLLSVVQVAQASYTRGYYKSNGTYVNGYHRSAPNYTKRDNYSTKGNYNPYTGKAGTVNPSSYSNIYSNTYKTNGYKGFGY